MKEKGEYTNYLIIGNSIAGVSAAEAIRELDLKGKIMIISDEDVLNYSRPLISYYLGEKVKKENMNFKDESFFKEKKIAVSLNTKAESIKPKKKVVATNRGKISFEKLLIATGGKPIIPPIEGLNRVKEGIFTFTKLSDAQRLIDYIQKNKIKEAYILGAGLIGLKATEGLVERGLKVNIIELADRVLANTFDKEASEILEEGLRKWGCKVIKEDTIIKLQESKGKLIKVILKSKKSLDTSLLIIAIGVKPNIEILEGSSITCDRGILVDRHLQTNIKDIYAAGDVACGRDFLTGRNLSLAIWPVASLQARVAGLNMAGRETIYDGLFIMNSVELAGIPTISFGITNPSNKKEYEILRRKGDNFYRKIILKDDLIVGAIFLGKIERAGIFNGLIRNQVKVTSFKKDLLNDDFGFLGLPKEYRKHLVIGEGMEV